jgi:hypothetical protein
VKNGLRGFLIVLVVLVWGAVSVTHLISPSDDVPQNFNTVVGTIIAGLMVTYRKPDDPDEQDRE